MKENRIIIDTEDGSSSIFDPITGEHYHSTHGAITESEHVFIKNGLSQLDMTKRSLSILEIGFGTGLNALLSLNFLKDRDIECHYYSIEKYPIPFEMVQRLNYCQLLGDMTLRDSFIKMHQCNWEEVIEITPLFFIKKMRQDISELKLDDITFDIVFFDAFSPNVQPELWSTTIFKALYNNLNENGLLTTYSVQGLVKNNLRSVGFKVKRLQGPPGKHHMLNAFKISDIV